MLDLSKSNELFSPGTALKGDVFHPLCKTRFRHPRELKLTVLIASVMFYKICKFECSAITNDVIMTSLPKQWQNADLLEIKQTIYHSKGIDESYPKMYLSLNLSHFVKSCEHFSQILVIFTMPAHKIWSCHVTQDANFENFLFCPTSTFDIRKTHKISSGKALYVRSYQPKTSKTSAFRVKVVVRAEILPSDFLQTPGNYYL